MNREDINREISIIEGLLMLTELNRANSKLLYLDDEGNQKTRHLKSTKRRLFRKI